MDITRPRPEINGSEAASQEDLAEAARDKISEMPEPSGEINRDEAGLTADEVAALQASAREKLASMKNVLSVTGSDSKQAMNLAAAAVGALKEAIANSPEAVALLTGYHNILDKILDTAGRMNINQNGLPLREVQISYNEQALEKILPALEAAVKKVKDTTHDRNENLAAPTAHARKDIATQGLDGLAKIAAEYGTAQISPQSKARLEELLQN
jgi:hypothetical protein